MKPPKPMTRSALIRRLNKGGWPMTCPACRATVRIDMEGAEASGYMACPGCFANHRIPPGTIDALIEQLAELPADEQDEAITRGL